VIDGRLETLKRTCDESLRRLRTEGIDLYYLHRWEKQVAIEESAGALADQVREGKVKAIGLSEVSAATLRRAHAVHPIAAMQSEYSLWTRNPEVAVAGCLPGNWRHVGGIQSLGVRVSHRPVARCSEPEFQGPSLRHAAFPARELRR